jgi:hypothetical protein
MNNWHNEFMAEYHRQAILEQAERIRLERIALKSHAYRPGFFARSMFSFANWMIFTGKNLRKRYEIPNVDCSKTTTESFAH